jgi:hypothetical protein
MVLIEHNENKPSALRFQKHEMQNFPNIQRLIDFQIAFFKKKKLALQSINQINGGGE